ncbi:hypothetical protein AAMO2058_001560400 [Amorphochlora amoebiformis]
MALPPPPKPRRRRTQSLAKMKDIVETFQPARSGKSELKGREKEHVKRTSEAGVPVEPPKPERKHGRTTTTVIDILGVERNFASPRGNTPAKEEKKGMPNPVRRRRRQSRASIVFAMVDRENTVKQAKKSRDKKKLSRGKSSHIVSGVTSLPSLKTFGNLEKLHAHTSKQYKQSIPTSNSSRKAPLPSGPKPSSETVDLLARMRQGASFLKFGTSGLPHFRHFQISRDNRKIQWFSKSKRLSDCEIDFRSITSIQRGQNTAKFQRHPSPELERTSFSVIYTNKKGKEDSLDVVAKDPKEFKIWLVGLKELLRRAEEEGPASLEDLLAIPSQVTIAPKKPAPPRPDEAESSENGDTKVSNYEAAFKLSGSSITSNKLAQKSLRKKLLALESRLQKARKLVTKKEKRAKSRDMSDDFVNLWALLERVDSLTTASRDMYQLGEFETLDHELWRATVELEAFDHFVAVV